MHNRLEKPHLPRPFIFRRLHSLLGLWLVVYLFFHLLVNAQAAFFFKDQGKAFIASVNRLEALPYLRVTELLILGLPFLIHGIWGMIYALQAKFNDHKTDGSMPALPQYKRNRAYKWERITAWILVVGILAHVIQMRFVDYPMTMSYNGQKSYAVRVSHDKALASVAEKLHVELVVNESNLDKNEVLAISRSPGAAIFLTVRETFKSKLLVILYSLFVIAAAYHAFNGLWTLMITWGISLTRSFQKTMLRVTHFLMAITTLMGLCAIWGTYWTVQFQEPLAERQAVSHES